MRLYLWRMIWGLGTICCVTPVLAANGPEKDGVPSPTAWIILLLPTVPILLMVYLIFRNARRNQAMAESSVARFEDHRRLTEEHMKRVELQIDRLNENLRGCESFVRCTVYA